MKLGNILIYITVEVKQSVRNQGGGYVVVEAWSKDHKNRSRFGERKIY